MRYNNPHKLSLYLSSGLPVIIWKQAAEATFVEKNGVGYTVKSLYEIPELMKKISENEYKNITENVSRISKKLINGEYMQLALREALSNISNI